MDKSKKKTVRNDRRLKLTSETETPPLLRAPTVLHGYHYRGVLCVPAASITALDAFALMDAEGSSALGVCDDAYRIVANISVSDLRGIRPEAVDRLGLNVVEFLRIQRAEARQKEDTEQKGGGKVGSTAAVAGDGGAVGVDVGVVACRVDATVGEVVQLMVTHRVHHVYVCSSDGHPLAVVTPHDILRILADRLVEG